MDFLESGGNPNERQHSGSTRSQATSFSTDSAICFNVEDPATIQSTTGHFSKLPGYSNLYEQFKNTVANPERYPFEISSDEEDYKDEDEVDSLGSESQEINSFNLNGDDAVTQEKEVDAGLALMALADFNGSSHLTPESNGVSSASLTSVRKNLKKNESHLHLTSIDHAEIQAEVRELITEEIESVLTPHAPNLIASYREDFSPDVNTLGFDIHPSQKQVDQLRDFTKNHFQLLIQQCAISLIGNQVIEARQSHKYPREQTRKRKIDDFLCLAEDAHDLGGVLDTSVMMLRNLEEMKRESLLHQVQFKRSKLELGTVAEVNDCGTASSKSTNVFNIDEEESACKDHPSNVDDKKCRNMHNTFSEKKKKRSDCILEKVHNYELQNGEFMNSSLSRLEFAKALNKMEEKSTSNAIEIDKRNSPTPLSHQTSSTIHVNASIFYAQGYDTLSEAFEDLKAEFSQKDNYDTMPKLGNICESLLRSICMDYDKTLVPGFNHISNVLTYPREMLGKEGLPYTQEHEQKLRYSKAQFTAAEDNLILRGVNLYGEKQWAMLSDRFLPCRTFSEVAHRYSKISVLIYIANGVHVDDEGKLADCPTDSNGNSVSCSEYDEDFINANLKQVEEPEQYGLYRWTMEEDIMLLKAVPLLGKVYAEIGKILIPHRHRGALRKRYQALERRVKGVLKREKKLADSIKKKRTPLALLKPAEQHGLSHLIGLGKLPTSHFQYAEESHSKGNSYIACNSTIPNISTISTKSEPKKLVENIGHMCIVNSDPMIEVYETKSRMNPFTDANIRKAVLTKTRRKSNAPRKTTANVKAEKVLEKNIQPLSQSKELNEFGCSSANPENLQPIARPAPIMSKSLEEITSNAVIGDEWCFFPRAAAVATNAALLCLSDSIDSSKTGRNVTRESLELDAARVLKEISKSSTL